MNIHLIAIGQKMPDWVNQAVNEYQKRLQPDIQLQTKEISVQKNKTIEGERLLAAMKPQYYTIALDSRGSQYTSEQFAKQFNQWKLLGKPLQLLIGGPDGYDAAVLKHVDAFWSLSPLTFAHPMVRVIVAEQLYRAQCILKNHPYHK